MKAKSSISLIPVAADDSASTPQSLPLRKRIAQKIATVRWNVFFTTATMLLDYFLLNASISLIAVFFPAEVSGLTGI